VGWSFVKMGTAYDFEVIRVGGSAGKAFLPEERRPAVANYFISVGGGLDPKRVVTALNARHGEIAETCGQTTAVRSLAKPPLIALLNDVVTTEMASAAAVAVARPRYRLTDEDIELLIDTFGF
jgi:hypothetical protein